MHFPVLDRPVTGIDGFRYRLDRSDRLRRLDFEDSGVNT